MFEYNFTSHTFKNPGYFLCDVPDCVKNEILDIMNSIENNEGDFKDTRKLLAGHLEKEYELPIHPNIKYLAESMSIEYDNIFFGGKSQQTRKYFEDLKKINYELKSLWINYSKKYDFNPIHTHSGSYSFVIWINIPFDLENEMKIYSPNSNKTSLFSFVYTDTLGRISDSSLYIDKTWEWKMAFFPSNLNHTVYPFYTSDNYRISVAGNVYGIPEYEN